MNPQNATGRVVSNLRFPGFCPAISSREAPTVPSVPQEPETTEAETPAVGTTRKGFKA